MTHPELLSIVQFSHMARPETHLPPLPRPQSQDLLYMLLTMVSIVNQ